MKLVLYSNDNVNTIFILVSKELSEEEREAVISTNEFHQFLSRAALVMERALTDPSDIMFDCYLDDGDRGDKCLGAQVMCRNIFCDEKLCKGRIAMDTHWSPHVSGWYGVCGNITRFSTASRVAISII